MVCTSMTESLSQWRMNTSKSLTQRLENHRDIRIFKISLQLVPFQVQMQLARQRLLFLATAGFVKAGSNTYSKFAYLISFLAARYHLYTSI